MSETENPWNKVMEKEEQNKHDDWQCADIDLFSFLQQVHTFWFAKIWPHPLCSSYSEAWSSMSLPNINYEYIKNGVFILSNAWAQRCSTLKILDCQKTKLWQ